MKRILLIAVGSRGDVSPYLGLAAGLEAAGHRVTVATHGIFEASVRAAGLRFAPMAGDPRAMVASDAGQRWISSGRNVLRLATQLPKLVAPMIEQSFADCLQASQDVDLLMPARLAVPAAQLIASKRGIPLLPAMLQPFAPTNSFVSIYSPLDLKLPGSLNYATHLISEQIYWLVFRRAMIGLAAKHRLRPPSLLVSGSYLFGRSLLGVSRAVIGPDVFPSGNVDVTGYWFPPAEPGWAPPQALADFLAQGPLPICIGFGSMRSAGDADRFSRLAAAFHRRGHRVVFLSGWGDAASARMPSDTLVIEEAPHEWLFPRVAAVIHHGGAGTTAAALRAGRASLVIPFFADQHFWARRLQELGLGPAPAQLDEEPQVSADALLAVLKDRKTMSRLAEVSRIIATEDGPAHAAASVLNLLED